MKSVEDEGAFFGVDTRTAVVDFERHRIAVRGDDHFHLTSRAGKLARVVDQDSDETIDGFARGSYDRVLIAQLHEDETQSRRLGDRLESLRARECNGPEINELIGVLRALFVGTRKPQEVLDDSLQAVALAADSFECGSVRLRVSVFAKGNRHLGFDDTEWRPQLVGRVRCEFSLATLRASNR